MSKYRGELSQFPDPEAKAFDIKAIPDALRVVEYRVLQGVSQAILDTTFHKTRTGSKDAETFTSPVADITNLFDRQGYQTELRAQLNEASATRIMDETITIMSQGKFTGMASIEEFCAKEIGKLSPVGQELHRADIEATRALLKEIADIKKEWKFSYDGQSGDLNKMSVDGRELKKDGPLWNVGELLERHYHNKLVMTGGLRGNYDVNTDGETFDGKETQVAKNTPAKAHGGHHRPAAPT